eukprot:s805_g28.t1
MQHCFTFSERPKILPWSSQRLRWTSSGDFLIRKTDLVQQGICLFLEPSSGCGMYRVFLLLLVASKAQDDDFMWFRCDACSASFFKINRTLIEKQLLRRASVASYEFLEIIDEVCDTMFTKHEYGVKQHEGKKYLFGPGVSDHIPGQGFGQMGMGDYDKRLASYCKMFVEEFGEEELQKRFWEDRQVNHTEICQAECQSSASGTGAQSKTPRKPKAPRSPRSPSEKVPKESAKGKPMPKTKPAKPPKATAGPKGGRGAHNFAKDEDQRTSKAGGGNPWRAGVSSCAGNCANGVVRGEVQDQESQNLQPARRCSKCLAGRPQVTAPKTGGRDQQLSWWTCLRSSGNFQRASETSITSVLVA